MAEGSKRQPEREASRRSLILLEGLSPLGLPDWLARGGPCPAPLTRLTRYRSFALFVR